MANVSGEVDVGRGSGEVFDYVADPTRRPEWQVAVEKIEVETAPAGGVGTRVRETRRVQGSSRTFTWEVTDTILAGNGHFVESRVRSEPSRR
jgi:hypothetical protein